MSEGKPSITDRFLVFIVQPMSLFWVLITTILIVGIISTISSGEIAWEAFFSAAMLSLLVHFLARRRDVDAWPWSGRSRPNRWKRDEEDDR